MSPSCFLKSAIVFGMILLFFGLPVGQYQVTVHEAFSQERDKASESKGTHTSKTLNEAGNKFDDLMGDAKYYFGKFTGWLADLFRPIKEMVDSWVGVKGDNKGTNAMFGWPLYIIVTVIGLFLLKFAFNIIGSVFGAMFGKKDEGPRGRSRPADRKW